MTVTVSQLRAWNPAALTCVGADIAQINRMFDESLRSVTRAARDTLERWEGDAAETARVLVDQVADTRIVDAVDAYTAVFDAAAREIAAVRQSVLAVVDTALAGGFDVLDDGSVRVADPDLQQRAQGIETQLQSMLSSAVDTDYTYATKLQRAVDVVLGLQPVVEPQPYIPEIRSILPDEPHDLAELWSRLTPYERDGLAVWDPTIGNRDGLPADDKSRYNTVLLHTLVSDARDRVAEVEERHTDWLHDRNLPSENHDDAAALRDYARWLDDRDAAETALAGYDTVQAELSRAGAPTYLLNIDEHGRGTMALNNPDTAHNVATYVPGASTVLASIGRDLSRAENLLDSANMVSGARNSVIAWLGYNAPPTLLDATSDSFADAGAPRLERFQEGLRAAHQGDAAHHTVLGHGYGSVVVERASLGDGDVVVAAADTSLPGSLDATSPVEGTARFDGSNYFDRGNPALDTIGRIIAGKGAA
ncbi:hypothetical protein CH293_06855 [Rhodococcus sp. 14-2470-1b]|uniref:alpha/beta hydrolase n=1 Tax=Rhodococcus sp. 14-2470-1b TaxID=2023149 RepID=UPI000B9C6D00|nr:alpha/beta hydrolase [Rhodococcus sp. 14-2470-1b]OZF55222.1 hypothetical protein CH293_06855 [Rhodococcus sp. 14-2470-1b]